MGGGGQTGWWGALAPPGPPGPNGSYGFEFCYSYNRLRGYYIYEHKQACLTNCWENTTNFYKNAVYQIISYGASTWIFRKIANFSLESLKTRYMKLGLSTSTIFKLKFGLQKIDGVTLTPSSNRLNRILLSAFTALYRTSFVFRNLVLWKTSCAKGFLNT